MHFLVQLFNASRDVWFLFVGDFPHYPGSSSGTTPQKTFLLFSEPSLLIFSQSSILALVGWGRSSWRLYLSQWLWLFPISAVLAVRGLLTPDWFILCYLIVWYSNSSYYTSHFQITVHVFSPGWDHSWTLDAEVGCRSHCSSCLMRQRGEVSCFPA